MTLPEKPIITNEEIMEAHYSLLTDIDSTILWGFIGSMHGKGITEANRFVESKGYTIDCITMKIEETE